MELPLHALHAGVRPERHYDIVSLSFGRELLILGIGARPQNWTMWQLQGRQCSWHCTAVGTRSVTRVSVTREQSIGCDERPL